MWKNELLNYLPAHVGPVEPFGSKSIKAKQSTGKHNKSFHDILYVLVQLVAWIAVCFFIILVALRALKPYIIAFLIIAGGAFSILVHNFLVREHPAWFIVYILMTILAVIVSAYISNEYMALLDNEIIGSTLQEFTMGNFIMQYLPYWSAVIGIIGGVFLFIGSLRDRELGGGFI